MFKKLFLINTSSALRTKFGPSMRSLRPFSVSKDHVIHLTFVDQEGNRAKVPARIGQTVLEVALQNKIDIQGPCRGTGAPNKLKRSDEWTETLFGEGPECFYCHVKIPSSFSHLLPYQPENDAWGLKDLWEEEYSSATSRLACQIVLEKKHDGLVLLVPDAPVTNLC